MIPEPGMALRLAALTVQIRDMRGTEGKPGARSADTWLHPFSTGWFTPTPREVDLVVDLVTRDLAVNLPMKWR